MSAQFITYADLGTRRNLKTRDIVTAIEQFERKQALQQVIFRLGKHENKKYIATVPLSIHLLLGVIKKILGWNTRKIEESTFDYFAEKKLQYATVTFFHPPRFRRTMRRAQKQGGRVVGIATNSHPAFVKDELNAELARQGAVTKDAGRVSELYYIQHTDYLVALSPFSKNTYVLNGYPSDRIFVASLDVDTTRFLPGVPSAEFTVVFPASQIGVLKGLQYLLDAWGGVDIENKRLIILGQRVGWPKEMERRYEALIASDNSICEKGIVQNPEAIIAQAHLAVLPTFTEGFSRSVAEALSCGVPVVTTDRATDTVNFFKDGIHGKLVPIADANSIAETIRYFYKNPTERAVMGANARKLVVEKRLFGEELFDVYTSIVTRDQIV